MSERIHNNSSMPAGAPEPPVGPKHRLGLLVADHTEARARQRNSCFCGEFRGQPSGPGGVAEPQARRQGRPEAMLLFGIVDVPAAAPHVAQAPAGAHDHG